MTDIDASLSPSQKAQRTAWWSHVESNLGDLVVSTAQYPHASLRTEMVCFNDAVAYILWCRFEFLGTHETDASKHNAGSTAVLCSWKNSGVISAAVREFRIMVHSSS